MNSFVRAVVSVTMIIIFMGPTKKIIQSKPFIFKKILRLLECLSDMTKVIKQTQVFQLLPSAFSMIPNFRDPVKVSVLWLLVLEGSVIKGNVS